MACVCFLMLVSSSVRYLSVLAVFPGSLFVYLPLVPSVVLGVSRITSN